MDFQKVIVADVNLAIFQKALSLPDDRIKVLS